MVGKIVIFILKNNKIINLSLKTKFLKLMFRNFLVF